MITIKKKNPKIKEKIKQNNLFLVKQNEYTNSSSQDFGVKKKESPNYYEFFVANMSTQAQRKMKITA